MGDRENKKKISKIELIKELLEICIKFGELRDETYVQLCKQMIDNPNPSSEERGWELMSIFLNFFPPSKDFETHLETFINEKHNNNQYYRLSEYCCKQYVKISYHGYKGKPTSITEIKRAMELPFLHTVFGDSLENIMKEQTKNEPELSLNIPKILDFLCNAIIEYNGLSTEGIFRLSGDSSTVSELRYRIERGTYSTEDIYDCNVYAGVLKSWFRELEPPLIPEDYYLECAEHSNNIDRIKQIVEKFPEASQKTLMYIIKFLKQFANDENYKLTKMNLANLATVFAPNFIKNPKKEFENLLNDSKNEQQLVYTLLKADWS